MRIRLHRINGYTYNGSQLYYVEELRGKEWAKTGEEIYAESLDAAEQEYRRLREPVTREFEV